MPEGGLKAGSSSLRWFVLVIPLLIADQWSKQAVVAGLAENERINLLPIFDLVRFHNPGAAFSLLADAGGWQQWFFTAIAMVVSIGIICYLWSLPVKGCRVLSTGLALVLSGAIGNLIDRLMYGYVVDFLLFYYESWSWPAFNVADSAISVGVVLIIYDAFFLEPKRMRQLAATGVQSSDHSS